MGAGSAGSPPRKKTGVAEDLPRGGGQFLFDGRAYQVAPLGPRAIVIADVLVAEQILQREPGVRAALSNAAVGDDFLFAGDTLAAVDLAEPVRALQPSFL